MKFDLLLEFFHAFDRFQYGRALRVQRIVDPCYPPIMQGNPILLQKCQMFSALFGYRGHTHWMCAIGP